MCYREKVFRILIIIGCLFANKVHAQTFSLIITEIQNANIDSFLSPAFNFDGWVELYNPSGEIVDLGGYSLQNNSDEQWIFPDTIGVVKPNGYFIVWFDSNDIRSDQVPFKLDLDGGVVTIKDKDGSVVASQIYPKGIGRMSYAMKEDGSWSYCSTPTPGHTNMGLFANTQLPPPICKKQSCLFETPFDIEIQTDRNTVLRYTTNGETPTEENSAVCSSAYYHISDTQILKFRSFQDGYLPSEVVTRSFIKKEYESDLPVLSVVTDSLFLYDDSIGVMVAGVNGKSRNGIEPPYNWNMNWERPVCFSYILGDNSHAITQDVNLEMCGGWSRQVLPHPFKLKANKLYGSKTYDYRFFEAKPFIRNRTLQMRNGGNDYTCRIKDAALASIVLYSGIDLDVQSYQPVLHYLNGEFKGLINMREPNNKHFVFANWGLDDDEIDNFEMTNLTGYTQKCGTEDAFLKLYDLSFQASVPDVYDEISELLDIDEYANYMASFFYLGRATDGLFNNLKGYRATSDGRFRFVQYDADFAFNTGANVFEEFKNRQYFDFVFTGRDEVKINTLFQNIIQNEKFRKKFIATYCIMGGSVFESSICNHIIDSLASKIEEPLKIEGKSPWKTANMMKDSLANRCEVMMEALSRCDMMGLERAKLRKVSLS